MARYGADLYAGGLYGASTPDPAPFTWKLAIDWDGDGIPDSDANEAARLVGMRSSRGIEDYINESGAGFEAMHPGRMTLTLDNYDRRYDPRYSSSPLYPNVAPGKLITLGVIDNDTANEYTVFTGYIDDIIPDNGPGGDKSTALVCNGNLQYLYDRELSSRVERNYTTISDAITALLLDANYPGSTAIDTDAQPVVSFAVQQARAAEVAHQLASAALGVFFVDVHGKACFYARNHVYGDSVNIDQSQCLNRIGVGLPWQGRFNQALVIANRKIKDLPCVIYSLPSPDRASAGSNVVNLYPKYSPAADIAISKIAFNSNSAGDGAALTGTAGGDNFLGPTEGELEYTLSGAGYCVQLEIRGRQWQEQSENHYSPDYGTIAPPVRLFTLDSPFMQDKNYAEAFAPILVTFLDDDRASLTIQIENRAALQFAPDLLWIANFTSSELGFSAEEYHIVGIDHDWITDNGQRVRTTYHLAKIITDDTAITPAPLDVIKTPPGLGDPGGDGDTTPPPDPEDFVPLRSFRISGSFSAGACTMTWASKIASWGDGEYDTEHPIINPDTMYDKDVDQTKIVVKRAGVYIAYLHFEIWGISNSSVASYAQLKLLLYDSTDVLKESSLGTNWQEFHGLGMTTYTGRLTMPLIGIFNPAVGDYWQLTSDTRNYPVSTNSDTIDGSCRFELILVPVTQVQTEAV